MADKQAVFTLKVDTGNSVQDVQNFDQAVKGLNKDLKETQTTASQQTGMDQFETKLQELNDRLKNGGLTMREMTKLMKEYQTLAAQSGTETPIGAEAIRNAAQLRDQLGDLRASTTALASDTVNLDTALAGVETGAAAFQGVQSAIALTGTESEALIQTMVKLQAAQGLVNAVQTIANKLNKDAILGIQLRSALQKAQNFILYGSVAATQAESTATKVATGAKVAMTTATSGANLALKLFRGALLATGIGALIVGIGLLIANFDKVVKFMQPVINGLKAIGDAIGLTDFAGEEAAANEKKRKEKEASDLKRQIELKQRAFDNEQAAIQRTIDLYNAQGKDVEKLTRLKLENAAKIKNALLEEQKQLVSNADYYAQHGSDLQRAVAQASQDIINQSTQEAKDAQNELDVFNAEQEKKRKDKAKEEAKERADNNKSLIKQIEDAQIAAIQNEDIRARAKLLKDAERSTQEINKLKADEDKKATLKKLIDEKLQRDLQALDDAALKKQQEAQKAANGFRIQQERDLAKMIEDIAEQNYQLTLSDQERELLAIQDKYFELETLAQGNADALNEIEIAKLNAMNDVNLKYKEQKDKQDEEQKQKDLKREQDILDFKLNAATQTFQLISSISELFAKKGEKAARRAFMIQKASSIAQATIETYKGANAIFASAAANPSSVLFPAQPFIAAGLAISAGIANVAKIASQKFEGGSAPSETTGSIPSDLTGASASSFTANTNAQTTNLSTLEQGAQSGSSMSQVYVLESDITGTQNKIKLQEAKTSF